MPLLVPNVKPFSPLGVQTFGQIDPLALNTNLNAIAAAFNPTTTTVTANTQLTTTLRNVLVDVSGLSANQAIIITLPVNPAIGDPPCIVEMLGNGNTIPANCVVTTSDGTSINGITLSATPFLNSPALWMAGDNLTFRFIGGSIGWQASGQLGTVPVAVQPLFGAFPWQFQTVMSPSGSLSVESLQVPGAFAFYCKSALGLTVQIGDATSTFNGNLGPFPIATNFIMNKITCLGGRAFEVTT